MFKQTLSKDTQNALALLGRSRLLDFAYLAGGTACALQLGHRISVDLDFFSPSEFDVKEVAAKLEKAGEFKTEKESWGTVIGSLEGVKFSLFVYKHPVLFEYQKFFDVKILDLREIAAMKIDAIASRGIKRDFVDLYFICKSGISLRQILSFYEDKYKKLASNLIHIQKSLVYFLDAEIEEMPKMLKPCKWKEVKSFFENEVRKIADFS